MRIRNWCRKYIICCVNLDVGPASSSSSLGCDSLYYGMAHSSTGVHMASVLYSFLYSILVDDMLILCLVLL